MARLPKSWGRLWSSCVDRWSDPSSSLVIIVLRAHGCMVVRAWHLQWRPGDDLHFVPWQLCSNGALHLQVTGEPVWLAAAVRHGTAVIGPATMFIPQNACIFGGDCTFC